MITFNYYNANIKSTRILGLISLQKFHETIRNPKKSVMELLIRIRETDDKIEKSDLKERLYSFTPCVVCKEYRRYSDILSFTGLMVLDFDFKTKTFEHSLEFKEILKNYNFIHSAWLSSSGKGVRAFVKIPICKSVDEFKSYFNYIHYKHELGSVDGFDKAPDNAVLPLFISYDKDLYINEDSIILKQTYIAPITPYKAPIFTNNTIGVYNPKAVHTILLQNLNKITDNGHRPLRAISYTLGGYVSYGYIYKEEAIEMICKIIESHYYLKKNIKTYQTTARTMIIKGMCNPTKIEKQNEYR